MQKHTTHRVLRAVTALALAALTLVPISASAAPATGQVVGYYEVYRGTRDLDKVDWQSLTRLNLAFISMDTLGLATWLVPDGSNAPELAQTSVPTVRAIVAARNRNNPKVKLLLSVGGATMSNRFSGIAANPEYRALLAKSAVSVATTLGLDGVDWDWEYPGRLVANNCHESELGPCVRDDDYTNFTKLLHEARAYLKEDQLQTVAVYFDSSSRGVPYDVAGMDAELDAWNVMAYDMAAPSWIPNTQFHAALSTAKDSLDAFVSRGATREKMIMGVPFYGYIWRNVPWAGVDVAPTAKQDRRTAGRQVAISELFTRYADTEGCKLYETGDGDYYYCDFGRYQGEWCAIDSVRVLQQKGNFVRDNGYGGLMSWVQRQDLGNLLMTRTMARSLR